MKKVFLFLLTALASLPSVAQQKQAPMMHAHNDYVHAVPFWEAFANGYESIEADIFLRGNTLCVAHEEKTISTDRSLEALYLEPLKQAFSPAMGKRRDLQLLIDIKADAYPAMARLVKVMEGYTDLVKTKDREGLVLVISGNRPAPKDYVNYPDYIRFDHQSLDITADVPWEKVGLLSLNFHSLTAWNGLGRMTDADRQIVANAIEKAHAAKRPIRFWASPDLSTAWRALAEMGVDYINTDKLFPAADYVRHLPLHVYTATAPAAAAYTPSFRVDGKDKKIRNVILFIGDGMGLAQITAGLTGNGNTLTMTQLKNIGLSKTQSADDYTTDSAAGATAMASGQKTKNRFIGMAADNTRLELLPEYLSRLHINSGVVTTDRLTGATPSAFYSHQTDRSMTKGIAADLLSSPLTLFMAGGGDDFTSADRKALETSGFTLAGNLSEVSQSRQSRIGYFAAPGDLPATNGSDTYLADAVDASLTFLNAKKQPFFLMVEGAKIDNGGHSNNIGVVVKEVIDMDRALAAALRFADTNDETLVIVTADHETGGLSLPQGNMAQRQVEGQFQSSDHSGILVPVFAYGPHADEFRGVYENTAIHKIIVELLKKYKR